MAGEFRHRRQHGPTPTRWPLLLIVVLAAAALVLAGAALRQAESGNHPGYPVRPTEAFFEEHSDREDTVQVPAPAEPGGTPGADTSARHP